MVKKETSLTIGEARKFETNETIIRDGMNSFVAVGKALFEIKRDRLFTDIADTFEAYCKKRWGFAKSRAYQLMDSARVIDVVSTIVENVPTNEAQARVLASLPNEQVQATVWAKAVETARKDKSGAPIVTAAHVQKVADEIAPKPPKPDKPTSGPEIVIPKPEEPNPPSPAKPARGQPAIDVRKFEKAKANVGKIVREMTDLKEHAGGAAFHETIRKALNEILTTLGAWQKAALK
jgi:hypothetical protein